MAGQLVKQGQRVVWDVVGNGGAGGNGGTVAGTAAQNGTAPGGGGGGGASGSGTKGTGAAGRIILTYTAASSGPPLGTCGMMGAGR